MNYIKKYLYIFVCTILLMAVAFFISTKEKAAVPSFFVHGPYDAVGREVSIYDAGNRNYYVFLPSYANSEQVTIFGNTRNKVSIGDVMLSDGMDCSDFDFEIPYDYSVNGQKTATIWFYHSENVATMFIDTATGSMERIHEDKSYEENASITLYTVDGTVNHSDDKSTLKGRGNSTWEREKAPYALTLSVDGDLLGMGEATNWVLLANAYDETNLNNKLALDLAAQVGLPWTPECRWVDIYLNGQYNGLYLLTEKIETHKNRLNIDTESGEFLCKVEFNDRWKSLRNPFLSEAGLTIEISYPQTVSEQEFNTIMRLVNRMENSILSEESLLNSDIIDFDSWVRRYLVDEICGNVDSDLASSYFYFSNGRFFAGPAWDYDLTFGNNYRNEDPRSFVARNKYRSNKLHSPYHSSLYKNESFYNRMVELYITDFLPILNELIGGKIEQLGESIYSASIMNSLRWKEMYESWNTYTVYDLADYLKQRVDFLNHAWIENVEYCIVQFQSVTDAKYQNIAVKKGKCIETTYIDYQSNVWIDTATGEVVDFSEPIMTDLVLSKQPDKTSSQKNPLQAPEYITILSFAILITMLVGMAIVDATRRAKERRKAEETQYLKVLI